MPHENVHKGSSREKNAGFRRYKMNRVGGIMGDPEGCGRTGNTVSNDSNIHGPVLRNAQRSKYYCKIACYFFINLLSGP